MPAHKLAVEGLTKIFGSADSGIKAVDAVDFSIEGDAFFSMLGPSGCGKTTTLRMIAGLETISSGRVLFDGEDFTGYSAFRRDIGMVFQSYALFPHMSVFENTAYGLRVRNVPEAEIRARVGETLDLLGLGALAQRFPSDLSGGQQQRVSIARALVYRPRMLLLDEPLANLDAKLRVSMREEIRRIQKSVGIMTLYVTHDQEEAMSVSDRIGVFDRGRLMQVGAPQAVYARPTSLFVADFIGKANFIAATGLRGHHAGLKGVGEVAAGAAVPLDPAEAAAWGVADSVLMVRPEHMRLAPDGLGLAGRVKRMQFLGSFVRYLVSAEGSDRDVIVDAVRPIEDIGEESPVTVSFDPAEAVLFRPGVPA